MLYSLVRLANRTRHSCVIFFFSSRRRHTRLQGDWSSDVCSSDLPRSQVLASAGHLELPLVGGVSRPELHVASGRLIAWKIRCRSRTSPRASAGVVPGSRPLATHSAKCRSSSLNASFIEAVTLVPNALE